VPRPTLRRYSRTALPYTAAVILIGVVLTGGCTRRPRIVTEAPIPSPEKVRPRAGFTIQVGAFRNLNNAVRLAHSLSEFGIDAYYFKHESGLFKVRFGDFSDRDSAHKQAEQVRARGMIEEFYIVSPETSAVAREADVQRISTLFGDFMASCIACHHRFRPE